MRMTETSRYLLSESDLAEIACGFSPRVEPIKNAIEKQLGLETAGVRSEKLKY